jgi:hypothetical protein
MDWALQLPIFGLFFLSVASQSKFSHNAIIILMEMQVIALIILVKFASQE